jgi:hypothetical protein
MYLNTNDFIFLKFRGSTALHRAARSGHVEMVVVLLQLGADVNAKDENDWYEILNFSVSFNYNKIILSNCYFY